MVRLLPETHGNLIAVEVSGKVNDSEYKEFESKFQQTAREYGKVRLYADATELQGATINTVWDDLKNMPYYQDVERFAIVGNRTWEEWAAKATSLFVRGQLKYFHEGEEKQAMDWVQQRTV